MAADHHPWVPAALLPYPLDTGTAVGQLHTPLLLVHGDRDTLIAPRHSDALRELNPQARVHRVPGAGHNDLQEFDDYRMVLRAALDDL